jgi:hypothetical protein
MNAVNASITKVLIVLFAWCIISCATLPKYDDLAKRANVNPDGNSIIGLWVLFDENDSKECLMIFERGKGCVVESNSSYSATRHDIEKIFHKKGGDETDSVIWSYNGNGHWSMEIAPPKSRAILGVSKYDVRICDEGNYLLVYDTTRTYKKVYLKFNRRNKDLAENLLRGGKVNKFASETAVTALSSTLIVILSGLL